MKIISDIQKRGDDSSMQKMFKVFEITEIYNRILFMCFYDCKPVSMKLLKCDH